MSTPPPQQVQAGPRDRPGPGEAPPEASTAGDPAAPRPSKYGINQVLWGIGGVIAGLAIGVLGTGAESSTATAAAHAVQPGRPSAARPTVASPPTAQGTIMDGAGLFIIGQNIRPGAWHTAGAARAATGKCYVALLRGTRAWPTIQRRIVTGPITITTTSRTRAIRTSGCRPWRRLAGSDAARLRSAPVPSGYPRNVMHRDVSSPLLP